MKKELYNMIDGIVLEVLFRGFRVLYREDERVRKEIQSWADHLMLKLVCGPGGPSLALQKNERYGVRKLKTAQKADITMRFKSIDGAFRVLSGQMSVADAYSAHQFTLEGDIYQTMSFVRCVEYLEAYLFPPVMSKRILKEMPEKQLSSIKVYALALLEGFR